MSHKICDATFSHLQVINHLLRLSKGYWGYDKDFLDCFIQHLQLTQEYLQRSVTKLLFVEDNLAGFYSFSEENNQFILDHFFIHPNYIRQGLGRKLWQDSCEIAKELRKKQFILTSDPHAAPFYIKMGCAKIGVSQSDILPGRYLPVFVYILKAPTYSGS